MEKRCIDWTVMEEAFEIVIAFEPSGKILFGNCSAREKLGYTQEELANLNMSKIFWQEFQDGDDTFDKSRILGKDEVVMYHKNSSCFPVILRCVSIDDHTEYLLAQDITLRKNVDSRIRKLKADEEANVRMKNEFTANVTHELRTPVNGIKGHVLTLLDSVKGEEQRKTLEVILYCCDNMSAIINNILDFSKLEAGKFTLEEHEFDFYKMMDQVIATHMAEIKKKELHISVDIDEAIPQMIIGDDLRIGQILNNLLSNAIKFTMVGQIGVSVSKTMQMNDEIELFFMVKDSGIGISKKEQDSLFESFQQADASITRRFGGTGLGLTITKQIVTQMGGSIHVDSEKGKGSSFSFNLRLHTNQNVDESRDLREAYTKWTNLTMGMEEPSEGDFLKFGSDDNRKEIRKRMEKLVLSIELGSWEKAEVLTEAIKALVQEEKDHLKKPVLQLEMAIRKENYDKSMKAFENLQAAISEELKNSGKEG